MSQHIVQIVINRLLTDEQLRVRLARDRIGTLAELHLRGFELTADEFDVFLRTDTRLWFWGSEVWSACRTAAQCSCADEK